METMVEIREPTVQFGDGMNTLEVNHWSDGFNFEIDHPWAGCTETGFGYTLSQRLSCEDAVALAEWLLARVALSESMKEK